MQADCEAANKINNLNVDRIRVARESAKNINNLAVDLGLFCVDLPLVSNRLPHYVQEQEYGSIKHSDHSNGNLVNRPPGYGDVYKRQSRAFTCSGDI